MFENFPISKFVYDSLQYTVLYCIAVSQTLNSNNSANLKQNMKIFLVVYQGPKWSCSIKKGGEKSRETVPLTIAHTWVRQRCRDSNLLYHIHQNISRNFFSERAVNELKLFKCFLT
jgi:hypothetical protein